MIKEQSYANHRRIDPRYHYTALLLAITLVGSIVYAVTSITSGDDVAPALLILGLSVIFAVLYLPLRSFPIKAQDRAIRAEENLRHFVLTGKLLDSKLRISQIVALRFAEDNEFPGLCQRAAAENMKPNDIKKAITKWRADHHRV